MNFSKTYVTTFNDGISFSLNPLFIENFGFPCHNYTYMNVVALGTELQRGFTDVWIDYFNKQFNLKLQTLIQGYLYRENDINALTHDDGVYADYENKIIVCISMKYIHENEKNSYNCPNIQIIYQDKKTCSDFLEFVNKHARYIVPNIPMVDILGYSNDRGFYTTKFTIKDTTLNIDENYNDDFKEIDYLIKNFIKTKDESGLVMLHGIPGTGKTFYIRHLLKWALDNANDNKIIYVPVSMSHRLADPNFVPFLSKQTGSTIIIEDAERVVKSREDSGPDNAVSDILNLTDGILGDVFKLKIILSFNMDVDKVDAALTRKGRLRAKYEFNKLTQEKSKNLLTKLGKNVKVDHPLSLTEIYNFDDKEFSNQKEKRSMGFGV